MPENNVQKFKKLLEELFMFDHAELDFGIYRIMNAKRDEITRFLDNDLLPQVRETLAALATGDRAGLEAQLGKAIEDARRLGVPDPEQLSAVKELRAQLAATVDTEKLEQEVFSDLYDFFRRYYSEGDFLSLRRYKAGVYAIPYEGEEVKLHWANADQYYIKTSEHFRDYAFKTLDGRRVHFKITAADTEKDNTKSAPDKERRFILCQADAVAEENGDLVARFEYRADEEKRKQSALNEEASARIMAGAPATWKAGLATAAPTEANPNRTLLQERLGDYTSRNTFDYFIHKDLGGFLRRELDFYIKNEVMHLDDIENEAAPRVEQYLAKIKAIRRLAHRIIYFLAQLENFQKKIWLKKKFVLETNYCVTLDRVPEALYPEIAANDAQREEWVRLFAIDEIKGDLVLPGYTVPLAIDFLKANPLLVMDTAFYPAEFKERLLSSFDDLDEQTGGLLVHSENFQALSLLGEKYRDGMQCIYIDPPYNTDASAILYKNDYKDSSWLALMDSRLQLAATLLKKNGIICTAIDDQEASRLRALLSVIFPVELGIVAVRSNPAGRKTKGKFAPAHEYAMFYGVSTESVPTSLDITEKRLARYPLKDQKGNFAWANFIRSGSNDKREDRPKLYYPIFVSIRNQIRIPAMEWDEAANSYVLLEEPLANEEVVYPNVRQGGKQIEKNWQRGHERAIQELDEFRVRRTSSKAVSIDFKTRMDEESLPITWWDAKEYASANYGAAELKALFGEKVFDFAKSLSLVRDCVVASGGRLGHSPIADYFAGSGTTGHAVINLNREDDGQRKYILVEMGEYFDTVLKPRIQKVIYSKDWKEGKPVSREGSSHMFKYLRLESYEDALNNLEMVRSGAQQSLLDQHPEFREDYTLRYMLEVESHGSASLLNIDRFADPFGYKLKGSTGSVGETREVNVDLVETFNYLIGLRVKHIDNIRDFRVVTGSSQEGEKMLVIWRNIDEKSNADLDDFFLRQGYNTRDMEFDVIYVNGDNNLENLKRMDETWKVRLIEEEFLRLMFNVQDV